MANTTFNPSDKSANITLSSGNLVATGNAGGIASVRSVDRFSSGKFYWEVTFTTCVSSDTGVGVANSSWPLTSSIGAGSGNGPGTAGVNQGGTYVVEGSIKTSLGAFSAGDVCCIALDLDSKQIWFRHGTAGNWNANSANNPATGVGGAAVTNMGGGTFPVYPAVTSGTLNDRITANFGDSAFAGAVPGGFTSGFPAAVTWDPSNKNAGIALSGSNLVATSSAGSGSVNQTARATQAISTTTKEYFEVAVSGTLGQYLQVGIMDGSFSVAGNITPQDHGAGYSYHFSNPNSAIMRNGSNLWSSSGTLASGDVFRIAINRATNRMWWAINNKIWSGTSIWMGDGTTGADPASGTGGLDISAVTGTIYPAFSSAWTGDVATFNGGAAGFAYAVPTGFVGIDSTVGTPPPPTSLQTTQIGIEEWVNVNAQVQATQIGIESWVSLLNAVSQPYVISASRPGPGSVVSQTALKGAFSVSDVGIVSVPTLGPGLPVIPPAAPPRRKTLWDTDAEDETFWFGPRRFGRPGTQLQITQVGIEQWLSTSAYVQITQVSIEEWASAGVFVPVTVSPFRRFWPGLLFDESDSEEVWYTRKYFPAPPTPPPVTNLQVTQVGVEEWFGTNPYVQITQVGIEEWISVALAPLTTLGVNVISGARAGIGSGVVSTNRLGAFNLADLGVVSWITLGPQPIPVVATAIARLRAATIVDEEMLVDPWYPFVSNRNLPFVPVIGVGNKLRPYVAISQA